MTDYLSTRNRVEGYFDKSATKVWERLTSDAPVSGVRATVRAGRDKMRALMLDQLPGDLTGARVLDAGCGTGTAAIAMAQRGAHVVAVDIAPQLIAIAEERMPANLPGTIQWESGDMLDPLWGQFDHIFAMDSMIYYDAGDIADLLRRAGPRLSGRMVFTLPPKTPMLMAMYSAGKLFPRADRSPQMVPQRASNVRSAMEAAHVGGALTEVDRVSTGFYKSTAYVYEAPA